MESSEKVFIQAEGIRLVAFQDAQFRLSVGSGELTQSGLTSGIVTATWATVAFEQLQGAGRHSLYPNRG